MKQLNLGVVDVRKIKQHIIKCKQDSDEPMTTFVTCLNCNNKWKF